MLDRREGEQHTETGDWEPLQPTVAEVLSAALDSMGQGLKGFNGIWFTGCTAPFSPWWLGGLTVPKICMREAPSPEASFWDYMLRVWSRAPLFAGEWHYTV